MTTHAELDTLRGMVCAYVLTAGGQEIIELARYIGQPEDPAIPLSVDQCGKLHRELQAIAAILSRAVSRFPDAPQRSDVRKHLTALQQWILQLEMHHLPSRLARFSQQGSS